MSSVSSSPVGRRETLLSRTVTEAVCPAGTRDGLSSLTQRIRYLVLLAASTDSTGRADHNMNLSKRRAEAVKDYLVTAYGVPRNRLEAIGRGQTMPINASDPANPANRRVQVVNIGQ